MVSSIRQPTGDHHKYTSDALRSAREIVLDGDQLRRSYPRPLGAPQVIVLVTGGPSDDPRTTAVEALTARQDGIHIFVVGVGPFVSVQDVESVASPPWKNFTFLVEDSRQLASVAKQLAVSICRRKSLSLFEPGNGSPTTTNIVVVVVRFSIQFSMLLFRCNIVNLKSYMIIFISPQVVARIK